jgi:hypothetical protein
MIVSLYMHYELCPELLDFTKTKAEVPELAYGVD